MPATSSALAAAALLTLGWARGAAAAAEPEVKGDAGSEPGPKAGTTPEPAAKPGPSDPEDVPGLISRADAAYLRRDDPGQLEEVRRALEAAEQNSPDDYGVLWRLARYYFWISDDPALGDDERSRLGKKGWEYGDRAAEANPKGVEGWFYAAGGMGNYSLGIGVLKALTQGIEGKFKDRLRRAEVADPGFLNGGIENAWGRFYYKLPWPKYDGEESERHLLKSLQFNPRNVRGRVYLAELYLKEDHPREARSELEKAVAQPPGQYDAPEERRYQERARALLAKLR